MPWWTIRLRSVVQMPRTRQRLQLPDAEVEQDTATNLVGANGLPTPTGSAGGGATQEMLAHGVLSAIQDVLLSNSPAEKELLDAEQAIAEYFRTATTEQREALRQAVDRAADPSPSASAPPKKTGTTYHHKYRKKAANKAAEPASPANESPAESAPVEQPAPLRMPRRLRKPSHAAKPHERPGHRAPAGHSGPE
jgi:hypothetical protein